MSFLYFDLCQLNVAKIVQTLAGENINSDLRGEANVDGLRRQVERRIGWNIFGRIYPNHARASPLCDARPRNTFSWAGKANDASPAVTSSPLRLRHGTLNIGTMPGSNRKLSDALKLRSRSRLCPGRKWTGGKAAASVKVTNYTRAEAERVWRLGNIRTANRFILFTQERMRRRKRPHAHVHAREISDEYTHMRTHVGHDSKCG